MSNVGSAAAQAIRLRLLIVVIPSFHTGYLLEWTPTKLNYRHDRASTSLLQRISFTDQSTMHHHYSGYSASRQISSDYPGYCSGSVSRLFKTDGYVHGWDETFIISGHLPPNRLI
ncbi:hypothetical protein BYT27DRAFT_7190430 [Phlegmacium glaucopus]|nr:hypothetical protein BYT27DRAFT_7190430 [Phlegmacium glaucopus]